MLRFVDTFTRYIWLWLAPMIIFPVIITLFLLSTTTYTAIASLWVEQPLFSASQPQGNSWQSPAQQMAGLLSELMSTRDFVNGVLDTTSRQNTLKSEADRIRALEYITAKTKVNGDNFRLISLSFTDSKEASAVETLQAIMNRFQAYYDDRVKGQGEDALTYYKTVVASAKLDLDKATAAVKKFIEDHPNQVSADSGSGGNRPTNPQDLEYANLNQNLTIARTRYDDANSNLERVLNSYGAYQQGQATTLRVQDKPVVLDASSSKIRPLALGIGGGLGVAIALSILGTIVLTLLDDTIRYGYYARQVFGRERVLEMPNYRPARHKKKRRQAAGEGIVNFEEGSEARWLLKKLFSGRKLKSEVLLRQTLAGELKLSGPVSDATK